MAIQVFCQCGASLSVPPAHAGKKVKCKGCGTVLKIPAMPGGDAPAPAPDKPAPDKPRPADKAPEKPQVDEFIVPEYEEVKANEKPRACPACGANAAPGDSACLACGAELGAQGEGLLGRVPRPVLFGVVALIAFGALFGVGNALWKASRPASLVREGRQAATSGDKAAAQAAFLEALQFDPSFVEAQVALANLGVDTKDDHLIERYCPAAIKAEQDPKAKARLRLAFARKRLRDSPPDHKTARNEAVDAKDEDPSLEAQARGIIGLAANLAGSKEEALQELTYAAAQHSEDPRIHSELAALLAEEAGKAPDARAAAEQSVKLDDKNAETWMLLASLRERTNDPAGAKQALSKVIELEETNAVAHARLSRLLLDEGKLDESEKEAKRAVELTPEDKDVRLSMGRVLVAQRKPKAAQEELEKALKLAGSGWDRAWEAELLLGRSLYTGGEKAAGERSILEALKKRPQDEELALEVARLAIENKDGATAVKFLQKALASFDASYDVHLLYARAHLEQDAGATKHEKVIKEQLRRCMDLDKGRPEAPLLLGTYLHDRLELEQSVEVLGKGLAENPRHKELLYWRGRACFRAKQWDESIKALETLQSVDPSYQDAAEWLKRAQSEKFFGGGGG